LVMPLGLRLFLGRWARAGLGVMVGQRLCLGPLRPLQGIEPLPPRGFCVSLRWFHIAQIQGRALRQSFGWLGNLCPNFPPNLPPSSKATRVPP
jgi:hypothetical protein